MDKMVKKTTDALEELEQILSTRKIKSVQDHSFKPAAVFLFLYLKDGNYCILLNKRTETVEHHKGEISFPGGARDPEDKGFLDTALRESHEEMGIQPQDVRVLGQLDDIATRSQFGVRVYVGTIPYPYPFEPSALEIAQVLEVPIGDLLDPANLRDEVRWAGGESSNSPCYAFQEHLIFGATAQIVKQFLELLPHDLGQGHKNGYVP